MNNNNIVAAAEIEAARNLKIYNKLADIAREVFTHINAETGKIYTPADIARAIVGGPVVTCVNGLNYRCDRVEKYAIGNGLQFADDYNPETVYNVEIDGFSCRVNGWKIFNVLDSAARSWDIASAARVTFEKPYETAARVVSFTLSAAAARELAACCAKDVLRPVMNGVQLDTRRRVLVASDGHVLRVVPLGAALTVDESAAALSYIIPAAVIKSGRVVTIDAKGIAATDKMSAPTIPGRFPNWAGVIPTAADAGRVSLTADQWRQLKKAVADVAKVHPSDKYTMRRVTIAHESYSNKLIVYAFNYDFNRERETVINDIATDAPAFSISFKSDDFKRIGGNVSALYVKDNARAIITTDAAGLSLVMPVLQSDDDKYYINFNIDTDAAPVELLPGLDIAAAAADIKKENKRATAAEFIKEYNDEHADEKINADTMADTFAQRYRYTFDDANEARRVLADVLSETTANESETTAAPAADQTTDADTMSDRENEHNDNESAPALTLPPLAALLTSNDAPALSLTLPTPSPRPVLLLSVLTSEESTNETPAADPDQITAAPAADIETRETPAAVPSIESTTANDDTANDGAPAVLVPVVFVDVCETAANDDTAAPGFAAAPVPVAAPLHFWSPANDDTRRPAVVLGIETGDTPANDGTTAHGQINTVFRYLLRAAAVVAAVLLLTVTNDRPTITTARPAADIETPAAVPSIESTTANDGAPAVLVPVANDDTAAPAAADIESTTARDTTANDDTARALLLTVTNDTTANDTTANDTARAIVAAHTLYEAAEITETSDTAAAVVLAAAADIESTTANDDTATDDTANDGAPATTGTTTPAAPATGSPAAVAAAAAVGPAAAVLALYLTL